MEAEPAATFNWSQAAVSSIEWHPTDSSVLAVSYRDDQTTLWDLSLEEDDVEQTEDQVPPQLLFIHQGQKNVKEIHWHPKMQGVLVTTAYDGINVFKTFNQ
jgi:ribosome assembly protein RRB1